VGALGELHGAKRKRPEVGSLGERTGFRQKRKSMNTISPGYIVPGKNVKYGVFAQTLSKVRTTTERC